MLNIEQNIDLKPFTTIKVGYTASFFARVRSKEDVLEAIVWAKEKDLPIRILGGGSNVLVSGPLKSLVLKNEIKGRELVEDNGKEVLVRAMSGEDWTDFVRFTVDKGWYGLENLFLIYGTVGAAPVQNIGAYGVELKDNFDSLSAIDLVTGELKIFNRDECEFAYRSSIFKTKEKNRYFIYSVNFRLHHDAPLKLDYGRIKDELAADGITEPTLKDVIEIIEKIRTSKLPDPKVMPNAGSFFKNVEISLPEFVPLKQRYPDMPHFVTEQGNIKIPSGWLIEQVGFKGLKKGPVGMHERQALVLINYDQADASQILDFSQEIRRAVKDKFGLNLEEEVNIF